MRTLCASVGPGWASGASTEGRGRHEHGEGGEKTGQSPASERKRRPEIGSNTTGVSVLAVKGASSQAPFPGENSAPAPSCDTYLHPSCRAGFHSSGGVAAAAGSAKGASHHKKSGGHRRARLVPSASDIALLQPPGVARPSLAARPSAPCSRPLSSPLFPRRELGRPLWARGLARGGEEGGDIPWDGLQKGTFLLRRRIGGESRTRLGRDVELNLVFKLSRVFLQSNVSFFSLGLPVRNKVTLKLRDVTYLPTRSTPYSNNIPARLTSNALLPPSTFHGDVAGLQAHQFARKKHKQKTST